MDYNMVLGYGLRIQQLKKAMAATSTAGHFDGHADALERYGAHHLI
jgi:hypothetical protein